MQSIEIPPQAEAHSSPWALAKIFADHVSTHDIIAMKQTITIA